MTVITSLRNYPVAGMDGFAVQELTITPEQVLGNRVFAVVAETELEKYQQDQSQIPLRATQIRFPTLTLFSTAENNGRLQISYGKDQVFVDESLVVSESKLPFHSLGKQGSLSELLAQFALPFRVSKKSKSQRWAVDCGPEIATWLSERLGKPVRLVKAVNHPDSPKHHFTWYTGLHAVVAESVQQLALEAKAEVDQLTFRYNVELSGSQAFAETNWQAVSVNEVRFLVTACERCGYIGIDRDTGTLATHLAVMQTVSRKYGNNFGIYLQPASGETVTLRVGDEVKVVASQ